MFVGDPIPSPLVGFRTTVEKIRQQPDKVHDWSALHRAEFSMPKQQEESVRPIIKWADMDQTLAESSYDMAVTSRSNTGTANSQETKSP